MDNYQMNIAICTDNNYVMPCMVTIASVLQQNVDCRVFVLTEHLSEDNKAKFKVLANYYHQRIDVKEILSSMVSGLNESNRFPKSIYFRFLLPEILPEADRVLYLDCDILVRENILDFYNTDLNGLACAAIEDQRGDDITIHNRILMFSKYFNSGVLLMNLKYWREHNVTQQLIDYLHQYPERCWFPDQDALNAVLEGKVKFMNYRYNMQGEMLSHRCYLQLSAQKWQDLDKAIDNPAIIHFTDVNKPWYKECRHPYKDEYQRFAGSISCIGFKLLQRDSFYIRLWTIVGKACIKILKKLGRDFPERKLF